MKSFEGFVNESYPIQTRMEFPAFVAIYIDTGEIFFVDLNYDDAMNRLESRMDSGNSYVGREEMGELFDMRRVKVEDLTKYPYNLTQEEMSELLKQGVLYLG